MKGKNMFKEFFNKIFDIIRIIKKKNAQIRAEREKLMAAEVQNNIYASYILALAAGAGEVRISRAEIAETVGKYRADVSSTEDEYIIRVQPINSASAQVYADKPEDDYDAVACNGAASDKTDGEGFEEV